MRYAGDDGELVYRYRPQTGTLTDITAQWMGAGRAVSSVRGWWRLFLPRVPVAEVVAPERIELVHGSARRRPGGSHVALCRGPAHRRRDLHAASVAEVAGGRRALRRERNRRVPHRQGRGRRRPAAGDAAVPGGSRPASRGAGDGPGDKPLFVSAIVDHCRTNASLFWFTNQVADDGATQNGGSRYLPKTDGQRNAASSGCS